MVRPLQPPDRWRRGAALTITLTAALLAGGCGTTREYNATEQLVLSDAVDKRVAQIDFRPLTGRKVYLDNSYLQHVKGEGFVNTEYVTSALRQQIVAAGCLIQDSAAEADVIIEARIGTLGKDDHRVTFGLPENNAFAAAAALIPGSPQLTAVPEIALARREAREAAVKISAFAYDRHTRQPIWQSGVDRATATARDTWVLGVGPFQRGSIRKETRLAGSRLGFSGKRDSATIDENYGRPAVDHTAEIRFQQGWPVMNDDGTGSGMLDSPPTAVAESQVAEPQRQDETEPQLAETPQAGSTAETPAALRR